MSFSCVFCVLSKRCVPHMYIQNTDVKTNHSILIAVTVFIALLIPHPDTQITVIFFLGPLLDFSLSFSLCISACF